ncbi:uncharacterized protein DUF222 [Haloactinopolyspora alba]|uniref:Uncharacterized protein DUF222 n=1 Tax=Haloactinopolyspora alba TaxID=648780 RepID=A0A2P8DV90_9ACTN|nr:HNH endonuclease signature motif containing protein [Haloactinopolyspora alba]PSL01121.1 uncharacterized protein DUF222 [Haloactinopolyspora alba]
MFEEDGHGALTAGLRDEADGAVLEPTDGLGGDPHDPGPPYGPDGRAVVDPADAGDGFAPEAVADMLPGPETADLLTATDTAGLDAYDLVEAAAGWQRLIAWAQARHAGTMAELTRRAQMRPADTGSRSANPVTNTAMDLAARTATTVRQAENTVGHAVQLVEDFPATHAALTDGTIDERRARTITNELGGHAPAVRRRVEIAVLPDAPELDSVALRRRITELLAKLAATDAQDRCRTARQRRYVAVTPAGDGMAHLDALLPAEDAVALRNTLDAAATAAERHDRHAGREPRTADQRRADALAAFAWTSLSTTEHAGSGTPLATAHHRPVTVHLTFPLTTMLGLSDDPAELHGYGPVPAETARHLAAAGVWTWLGTHPATGEVLDHGRTRYRPTQALVDHVILRDRECRAVGCHRPAIRCEIDHRDPFSRGGPTAACNCHTLCKTHHLLKHGGGWHLERTSTGVCVWLSPSGHRYTEPPERTGPVIDRPGTGPPPF